MKFLKYLSLSLPIVLAACGGGEGGSHSIDFSPDTLQFKAAAGQAIVPQSVSVDVGLDSSDRYVGVDNKTPSLASVTYNVTHIDAFSMTISPVSGLAKGTYTGKVDALVCYDSGCGDVADRGTYTYTIVIN